MSSLSIIHQEISSGRRGLTSSLMAAYGVLEKVSMGDGRVPGGQVTLTEHRLHAELSPLSCVGFHEHCRWRCWPPSLSQGPKDSLGDRICHLVLRASHHDAVRYAHSVSAWHKHLGLVIISSAFSEDWESGTRTGHGV